MPNNPSISPTALSKFLISFGNALDCVADLRILYVLKSKEVPLVTEAVL